MFENFSAEAGIHKIDTRAAFGPGSRHGVTRTLRHFQRHTSADGLRRVAEVGPCPRLPLAEVLEERGDAVPVPGTRVPGIEPRRGSELSLRLRRHVGPEELEQVGPLAGKARRLGDAVLQRGQE
jgi:hypothetical protein